MISFVCSIKVLIETIVDRIAFPSAVQEAELLNLDVSRRLYQISSTKSFGEGEQSFTHVRLVGKLLPKVGS